MFGGKGNSGKLVTGKPFDLGLAVIPGCVQWIRMDMIRNFRFRQNRVDFISDLSSNRNNLIPFATGEGLLLDRKKRNVASSDGTTTLAFNAAISLSDFTIAICANNTKAGNGRLFGNAVGYNSYIEFATGSGGAIKLDNSLSGGEVYFFTSNYIVSDAELNYVYILRRIGTSLELWRNGALFGTITIGTLPLNIGQLFRNTADTNTRYQGTYAEHIIYSRAITDDELRLVNETIFNRWINLSPQIN